VVLACFRDDTETLQLLAEARAARQSARDGRAYEGSAEFFGRLDRVGIGIRRQVWRGPSESRPGCSSGRRDRGSHVVDSLVGGMRFGPRDGKFQPARRVRNLASVLANGRRAEVIGSSRKMNKDVGESAIKIRRAVGPIRRSGCGVPSLFARRCQALIEHNGGLGALQKR